MANKQLYWKGEDELMRTPEFLAAQKNEFPEGLPLDEVFSENNIELNSNRRDFLKFFGFSVAAVSLAACNNTKVRNVVPYLVKPEEVTPGVPNYYHSTCGACTIGCGISVKTREGRPIKLDGSELSPVSKGGLCSSGQASILSLYDTERLSDPMKGGAKTDWATIDADIIKQLEAINAKGGKIAIVSPTIHSPSALSVVKDFTTKYVNTKHIMVDPVSHSGILTANKNTFGKGVIPYYKFDKANIVVGFGADYEGTWLSTVEYTGDAAKRRNPDANMSRTYAFEANLSLTGSNADYRFPMKASNEAVYVTSLYNYIAEKTGGRQLPMIKTGDLAGGAIKMAGEDLLKNKGASLVLSGSNDANIQSVINGINLMLGNYGNTIDLDNYSNQYKSIDAEFVQLVQDMKAGQYAAVIFWDTNPVYFSPMSKDIEEGIRKTELSISFGATLDETSSLVEYVAPASHFLESWGDAEPRKGVYQLIQPTISPVFNTRQAEESLLAWAGVANPADPFANKGIMNHTAHTSPYYSYVKNVWKTMTGFTGDFDSKFNEYLHDGVMTTAPAAATVPALATDLTLLIPALEKTIGKSDAIDLVLYQNVGIKTGELGNNPILQELPDPLSKVTWDNYLSLPKALAEQKGIENGDLVDVSVGSTKLSSLPVFIQPGQSNMTVGIAVGYGKMGKVGEKGRMEKIGQNAYPFMSYVNGTYQNIINGVKIDKVEGKYELAQTQTHHTIEGRDHVRETTLKDFMSPNPTYKKESPHLFTLWNTHEYKKDGAPNHLWALAVDLNQCNGCGACIVSCHVENNVPVVGRAEVRRRREMHWLRIDRYFTFTNVNNVDYKAGLFLERDFEGKNITKETGLKAIDELEAAKGKGAEYLHYENVRVVHQPMMCQHCGNAPCETVCPVLATTHSTEGLNQMTYNRCIGTKYCANNCPYKVRRFNWFRYNDNDKFDFYFNNDLGKMVINPDVTVRTRGVMEKCSMCIQSIQAGKLKAKREKRKLDVEKDITFACKRTCSANAIVFGDLNDPNSEVSKLFRNERSYRVLEELNVQSSVKYLTKVRNTETL